MKKPCLLVFVVAYYAEGTLRKVLDRIPRRVLQGYSAEILVVDDASADRTFDIGNEYRREYADVPLTVLRNPYNQGYGGNQKIGYAYALKNGFDFVALVHGDGQYAPEELPRLLAPLIAGEADAVFGSRFMPPRAALKGRMPLYKFVGNRILTAFQNVVLGTSLSEFHSGYRIYSAAALSKVAFRLNSNDFHFDTEIIIQLLEAGSRIVEVPIPTYYGTEISRVNGLRYALNVALVTLRCAAHRAGLLYQRRFDPVGGANRHYGLKLGYPSSLSFALAEVPAGAAVLDIGAGPEGIASELSRRGCHVTVVDQFPPVKAVDGVTVVCQDLDGPFVLEPGEARYVLLLDIIEHLKDPELFLEHLREALDGVPRTIVFSTPNIAFVVNRLMLLLGQFNYGRHGILDRTHTRVFTFRGVRHLLRDEGFRIRKVRGVPAPFPKVLGNCALARLLLALNSVLIRLSRTLFSYQIFVVAESTPSIGYLLREAERSREGAPSQNPHRS